MRKTSPVYLVGMPPMLLGTTNLSIGSTKESLRNCPLVVHSRQDWNRFLGDIYTSKDTCSLRDTGKALVKHFGWQVRQLEVDVILFWANTTALSDFDGLNNDVMSNDAR